jgi:ligand-binding sensor domain-containing protein
MKAIILGIVVFTFYLNSAGQKFIHYTAENSPLPSNRIQSVFIDQNNNKWIGTDKGLVLFDNDSRTIYTTADNLAGINISGIVFEQTNYGPELWLATTSGVSVATFEADSITSVKYYTSANSGLKEDSIVAISVDSSHNRWFGTSSYLSSFTGNNWNSTNIDGFLEQNPVLSIGSGLDGWNYIGTKGGGVARVKRDEVDGITSASAYDTDWSGLLSNNIYASYIDKDGNQWFGTDMGAAFHEGTNTKSGWTTYESSDSTLIDNVVQVIEGDDNNGVWFGTPSGASRFARGKWSSYTVDEGLISNNILDISIEKNGSVWFCTDKGISVLTDITGIDQSDNQPGKRFLKIYPNPATDRVTIEYNLPQPGIVNIQLISLQSKVEELIYTGFKPKGLHIETLDLNKGGIVSGIYYVKINAGLYIYTEKIVIINVHD